MPRLAKTTTIHGTQFRVLPVGAETGGIFLFRVGRALAGLFEGLKIKDGVVDFDMSGIGPALQSLPPTEFQWAMEILKESTSIGIVDTKGDGRTTWVPLAQEYDDHFASNYASWSQWVRFAVEANGFLTFFDDLLAASRARKAPSKSSSPQAADGGAHASSSTPA